MYTKYQPSEKYNIVLKKIIQNQLYYKKKKLF